MSLSRRLEFMAFLWVLLLLFPQSVHTSDPKNASNLGQSHQDFFFKDDPKGFFEDPMAPRQPAPDFSSPLETIPFQWNPKEPFNQNKTVPRIPLGGENEPTQITPRRETMPGLPAWLKPGVRITYYVAFADTPSTSTQLVKGKAKPGQGYWEDTNTGETYVEKETYGTGGQGIMEVNVAYVDQQVAALDIRLFGKEVGTGDITVLSSFGDLGEAKQCKDFWVHPMILAQVKELQTGSGTILRMPYHLNNRTYNAIRFQGKAGHHTYDMETGLLIARHGTGGSPPVLVGTQTGATVGAGSTYIGIIQFLGVRETHFPWNGGPVPDWVGRTRSMTYQGKYTADVTAAGVYSFPVTMKLDFKNKGSGWIHFTQVSQMQAPSNMPQPMPGQVERINGSSQVGGLWIFPVVLRQLRPGQILDRDPFTGMILSATRIDGNRIRLHEANSRDAIEYVYDLQSGMLVGGTITKTLHMVRMTTALRLTSRD